MDSNVIVPITKLKARSAWEPQPSGATASDDASSTGRVKDGETKAGGKCRCCPYGYHIDLDFVRYCESLVSGDYVRKLKQLHRSRRQQRKSIEALLLGCHEEQQQRPVGSVGSVPPDLVNTGDASRDSFTDAMLDFEDAFKMSNATHDLPKVPCHLELAPVDLLSNAQNISISSSSDGSDVTSPNAPSCPLLGVSFSPRLRSDSTGSLSTVSSSTAEVPAFYPVAPPSKHMADTMEALANCSNSVASQDEPSSYADRSSVVCINPTILQTIRDQMAVSLNRMKELEDHAKAIPVLQVKLSVLKEEKRLLMLQLKAKAAKLDDKWTENASSRSNDKGGSPLVSAGNVAQRRTRTMSVSCSVMTRDVSVGSLPVAVRSVSVDCAWSLCPKCQVAAFGGGGGDEDATATPPLCPKCEMSGLKEFSSISVDTDDLVARGAATESTATCTDEAATHTAAVQAVPSCRHAQVQAFIDNLVSKPHTSDKRVGCAVTVRNIGVMTNLDVATKETGSGDSSVFELHCEICLGRKSSQKSVAVGLHDIRDTVPCDRCSRRKRSVSVGVGTEGIRTRTVASGSCAVRDLLCDRCDNLQTTSVRTSTDAASRTVSVCDKCSAGIKRVAHDLVVRSVVNEVPSGSHGREFRRQRLPVEFYMNRSFVETLAEERKQPSDPRLPVAATDRAPARESSDSSDDDDTSGSDSTDEASYDSVRGVIVHSCQDDEAIRQGRPGAVMFQPIQETARIKSEPSDAMRAACLFFDEHLRSSSVVSSHDLNAHLNVLCREWFRVSSQKNTDQQVVEDYLDVMESISHAVLSEVVNLTDESGNTAMHYAVSYANFDVVSLLLDSKVCNISKPNKAGYTPLMLASLATVSDESYTSVLKQLFKMGDVNMKASQHGQTALMLAASHGKAEMVRILLDAGADANIQDDDGSTALMCASEHGHLGVVRLLLAHADCDPNLADNDGSTALSIAMEAGHKDVGLMIYAATSLSRGSSPYASLRLKWPCSTPTRHSSTPPPPHAPPSPAWSRKSTSSVP